MTIKKSAPIKPDKSRERRYQLFLLALLGYITRQAKETGINDPDLPISEKLRVFADIQRMHEERLKKAPSIVETVFGEARDASIMRADRAVAGLVETAPMAFDTSFALNDALNAAVAENVSLVRNLSQGYLDKIQVAVLNYHQTGTGILSEELQKINGMSKNRARLIARDQMNKLHGEVVRIKSQSYGSIGYQWHNMQDERVRGNPRGKYPRVPPDKNHWTREGKYFLWAEVPKPPVAPDGKFFNQPPEDGVPGHAINCRCVATPLFNFSSKNVLHEIVPSKDTVKL